MDLHQNSPAFEQYSLRQALQERRSVRGFLAKPVPQATLEAIFTWVQRAPSNCNIQPWHCYVASGAARERIKAGLLAQVQAGRQPNPDYSYPERFAGLYRERQVACAAEMYSHMGIERSDKFGRMRANLRNFELFDAPHVAFIGMHAEFAETVALDVGIYLQTLMLLITAHGLASCAQGALRSYPDVVREEFGLDNSIRILVGLSFGYEDPQVPANRTRTERAPLTENISFKQD